MTFSHCPSEGTHFEIYYAYPSLNSSEEFLNREADIILKEGGIDSKNYPVSVI